MGPPPLAAVPRSCARRYTAKHFEMNFQKLLLPFLALTLTTLASGRTILFRNGDTRYRIAVDPAASVSEKTAAKELQAYLQEISGATFPIVTSETARRSRAERRIWVGCSEPVQRLLGVRSPEADDEGFVCTSKNGDLFLYGGRNRGTLYGVYSFLEKYLGVRWYTPDCTVVPKRKQWHFQAIDLRESPAIRYRHIQYHHAEQSPAWLAHNLNNSAWVAASNEYGGIEAYWNAHTFGQFVPVDQYYSTHPEYFSMIDGLRVSTYAQLCLSNPEVLRICIAEMKKAIAANPEYWVYSMSQNDNDRPCQCEACRAIEKRYGGHSGLILWFVNQVADAIKAEYPGKYIGTFAYTYTRRPPEGIVPRDNVVIRLCSIECCFGHPLEGCETNRPFLEDIREWSRIAPRLFIWDYVVNFYQFLAPFPNFGVLADNIKTYRKYHAIGIQEEAQYSSEGGEFAELRAWVLAKLLWNPDQPTLPLVQAFIRDYYGVAAPFIQEYFDATQALVTEETHPGIYIDAANPLYTEAYLATASGLLEKARQAVFSDAEMTRRVDRVRIQILYLKNARDHAAALADGTCAELLRILHDQQIRPGEWISLESFTADQQ